MSWWSNGLPLALYPTLSISSSAKWGSAFLYRYRNQTVAWVKVQDQSANS